MHIRPETPADFAAVARVHALAFDNRTGEPVIVALLRHHATYDPDLSLVAELDGHVIGHALFMPYRMQLMGETIDAVNLAPIAIDPAHQRKGIGAALMNAGHAAARAKGYALSFLLGHPEYYPRFGYMTGVYGSSVATVPVESLPEAGALEKRGPLETDIPALQALWQHEERDVDFALQPGPNLMDWMSPNPQIDACIYLRDGELIGYTRVHKVHPAAPRIFLAADADSARAIAADLAANAPGAASSRGDALSLPLHLHSASASAFDAPVCTAWEAGMALPLVPGVFDRFHAALKAGDRPAGRPIWPVAFDLG
jgi:predicted N-acetyltransferase YhbS